MKPVKKTSQGAIKKAVRDNNKKIPSFFQSITTDAITDAKPIYVEILKKTLESESCLLII